jgi:hypothetical protein
MLIQEGFYRPFSNFSLTGLFSCLWVRWRSFGVIKVVRKLIQYQGLVMKKILLIGLIFLILINTLAAQNKMIVDDQCNGYTYYGRFSTEIASLSVLPSKIQFNIKSLLEEALGEMSRNIQFSHGQVIDLKKYFSNDSVIFKMGWIVPKYDLTFILRDSAIGLKSYCLELRIDEYGKIIKLNWPRKYYSDKIKFKPRNEIEQFALRKANFSNIDTNRYKVRFKYNDVHDKLCWVFMFPIEISRWYQEYKTMEIDWGSMEIVDEYLYIQSTVAGSSLFDSENRALSHRGLYSGPR